MFSQHTWVRERGLSLGHQFIWQSAEYLDAANFQQAPARALHSLHLRVRVKRLAAEFSVLNLLNRTFSLVDRNPLDDRDDTRVVRAVQDFNGYPLPGRTWMLTLRTATTKD